jgi:opine dehydrogenase
MALTAGQEERYSWAVIGGGNGGQALSGHLALMGFPVRLYDIFPKTIEAINIQGGIQVDGVVEGFGKLELATTHLEEALKGADIIMIVAPALAHKNIAQNCAPLLQDGQIVFIHPGATCGALEFQKVLNDEECQADVTIAEANSLLYACRCPQAGHASIFGIKNTLMVAALPATDNEKVVTMLNSAFPQMYAGKNVLETSLENLNAMMHPGPTLLNTSMIESGRDWLYYYDGITPTIGTYVEEMDKERLAIGRALGLELRSMLTWYELMYDAKAETLSEAVKKNKAYAGVKGQKELRTRYVLEDLPMSLVPQASLGKMLGVPIRRMEAIIELGNVLLDEDFRVSGRTLESLGLSGMSAEALIKFVETGER